MLDAPDWDRFWELLTKMVHTVGMTDQEKADEIAANAKANGIATERDLQHFSQWPYGYNPPATLAGATGE
jgi:hypothetical protein